MFSWRSENNGILSFNGLDNSLYDHKLYSRSLLVTQITDARKALLTREQGWFQGFPAKN